MPRLRKPASPFRYFNSSPEVIRLVVMMYVRFPLSGLNRRFGVDRPTSEYLYPMMWAGNRAIARNAKMAMMQFCSENRVNGRSTTLTRRPAPSSRLTGGVARYAVPGVGQCGRNSSAERERRDSNAATDDR